jgi:hypothetical protein
MIDDIPTRLRNWHDQHDSWQTLTEAADEIERLRASVINTFDNGFDEIERLQHQNKIMADLLWHFMQNTDENLNANLCILHRAAQKLAIKGDG